MKTKSFKLKSGKTVKVTSKKIINKAVKKAVGKVFELKRNYQELATTGGLTSTTPYETRISGTVQGDNEGQRIGNQITIKAIHYRAHVNFNSLLVAENKIIWVRLIIYKDTEQAGTQVPTGSVSNGLLQAQSGDAKDYNRFINYTGVSDKRFKILYDRTVALNPSPITQTAAAPTYTAYNQPHSEHRFVFNKHYKSGLKVRYIGTTNAQASDGAGAIYARFFTNDTTGCDVDTYAEIDFTDN